MTPIRFGSYELHIDQRLLFREGELVPLPPRALDLLLVLVQAEGRVVSKNEILERVWDGAFVEEANIAHQISALRKTLRMDGGEKAGTSYIETLPRRGYRFVTDPALASGAETITVTEEASRLTVTEEHSQWGGRSGALVVGASLLLIALLALVLARSQPKPSTPIRTLAILPFTSLNGDQRDYLLLGMPETLINRLSGIQRLTVRPLTAVLSLPRGAANATELGKQMQVDAILEGSIQRNGNRLRVTSRLVRTGDGTALWSGKFDEPVADLFTIQDEISERVAVTLVPAIVGEERHALRRRETSDPEAYALYVQGQAMFRTFTSAGRDSSIDFYRAAIKRDPKFVLPWVGIANAYSVIAIFGPMRPGEAFPRAREAARTAFELDPNDAEVLTALGIIDLLCDRKWEKARQTFARALSIRDDLLPALALSGYSLQAAGRPEEALEYLRRERKVDPVFRIPEVDVLEGLVYARHYAEAVRECDAVLARDPSRDYAHLSRGVALAQLGRYDEALKSVRAAAALGNHEAWSKEGWLLGLRGDRTGALRAEDDLMRAERNWVGLPFFRAVIHAGLGDHDAAFRLLNEAESLRYAFIFCYRLMPEFDSLRSDPRYAELAKRLNLPS